jgi:hypothetical protein
MLKWDLTWGVCRSEKLSPYECSQVLILGTVALERILSPECLAGFSCAEWLGSTRKQWWVSCFGRGRIAFCPEMDCNVLTWLQSSSAIWDPNLHIFLLVVIITLHHLLPYEKCSAWPRDVTDSVKRYEYKLTSFINCLLSRSFYDSLRHDKIWW